MKRISPPVERVLCEVEVTEGLEQVTIDEMRERFGSKVEILPLVKPGEVGFQFSGSLGQLRSLQTVYAAYLVYSYDVPRPKGLLGDAHFRRLLEQIERVLKLSPNTYRTFSIAAAGSESSVMQRIKTEIAAKTGLTLAAEKGDLLIRIRPSQNTWQTVIRLSPRPLVTRAWRVCNLEGALNAATAHAMLRLTRQQPEDKFLNIGCGSGTLLIERLNAQPARVIIGVDNSTAALECAQTNIDASGETAIALLSANITQLPFSDAVFNRVAADLPFGQLTGSHQENVGTYPLILREAARVTRHDGLFTLITHEVRLMDRLLREQRLWHIEQSIQVNLRGLHPRIYVLRRTNAPKATEIDKA